MRNAQGLCDKHWLLRQLRRGYLHSISLPPISVLFEQRVLLVAQKRTVYKTMVWVETMCGYMLLVSPRLARARPRACYDTHHDVHLHHLAKSW